MEGFDVKWPEADLKALAKQIERAQLGLGKTLEESLIWAGVLLAKGAGARTSVAPKKRKTLANPGTKEFPKKFFPFYREIWLNGPQETFKWYLKERSDTTKEKIARSGLAKKSWLWMIPGIKGSGMSNFASSVEKKVGTFNLEIEMANMLAYITKALKESDGQVLLNDALAKTANRMEKIIDKKLERLTA